MDLVSLSLSVRSSNAKPNIGVSVKYIENITLGQISREIIWVNIGYY